MRKRKEKEDWKREKSRFIVKTIKFEIGKMKIWMQRIKEKKEKGRKWKNKNSELGYCTNT